MPVRKVLLASSILVAMVWTASSAQSALTLEACLERARAESPALKASENSQRQGRLAEAENAAAGLPQIKGVAGAIYAPTPPPFGYDAAISNGGQLNAQVAVQQSLYDGGVRRLKADQLRMESDELALEHRRTERDLVAAVKESFIDGLRAQMEVELHRTSIAALEQYLDLVRRMYQGGGGSYTDVLKTELQLQQEHELVQKADEAMALAKQSLSEAINARVDSTITLSGTLETLTDTPAIEQPDTADRALELAMARNAIDQSLIDIDLAKGERSPTLTLMGDAGYLSSLENMRLPADLRLSSFGFSVGIGLEVPFFNGNATALRIEQRQIASENLRFQLELARRSHVSELNKIQMQLTKAAARLASVRSGMNKAEENYLLTKSKYAGGAALSLEVLSAQQLMTDMKLNELETLADIQHLHVRLEQLTTH